MNNLVRAVEKLKDAGFWIYGADAGGETCGKIDFAPKSVIVMGSEGKGISKIVLDNVKNLFKFDMSKYIEDNQSIIKNFQDMKF